MMKHFPDEIIKKKNDSDLMVWFKNGSIWRLLGGDDIDKLRGVNGIDFVFDEFDEMRINVWPTLRPIIDENKGTATFVFTPKGQKQGYKRYKYALAHPKNYFAQLLTVDDTDAISKEALEDARNDPQMTEAFFQQEYYCKFTESGSQCIRRIKESVYEKPQPVYKNDKWQIGIDLAKYQDFTVITCLNLHTFEVDQDIIRTNKIDWIVQETMIENQSLKHSSPNNKAKNVVDATGIGDRIVEALRGKKLNILPFKFNEQSRKDLLNNLIIKLEKGIIKIPNNQLLIDELESLQYVLKGNKIHMEVSEGTHDDMIMSLALACWDIPTKPVIRIFPEEVAERRERQRQQSKDSITGY